MEALKALSKFVGSDQIHGEEFTHPNIWHREDGEGWSRLVIGAREKEIPLILDLCRSMQGPFGILYILLGSRLGREPGRYQSLELLDYDDLELFLYTFQEFFEQDGRHHLWVQSASGEGQFIFDNHNLIFAYGDVDRYEATLGASGFQQGQVVTPSPHTHNFHPAFDVTEDELFEYWDWQMYPLEPGDDY